MDLFNYATSPTTTSNPTTTANPTSPRPQGHIWSTRLASWVVPITRKPGRRPSPQHVHCSEPPCWVLVEALDPDAPAS
ncbi:MULTISPECIES: hypothetical protein [unclassified Cyanobium]|uniref:hypothetical protein n=1 Tax=unclassified Cyanobium TaxID=2627006 RepID=UPI0020CDEA4B|nr:MULTISPECIES: hypothetical protein [unclassified Cyanobium]MCP9860621.1 hypothetical protein [Cyanobium sp. Cruz-8H5]MCP9867858.1 hypothetical protein [Cyanobium sp. Cruz-8D1]